MKVFTVVVAAAAAAAVLTGVIGCKSAKQEAPAPATQAQPAQDAGQAGIALTGKVVETMDAAGYTYVSLSQDGNLTWVALPQTKIKVGEKLSCRPGMVMQNFTSKSLNRTFDSIIFSEGII